MYTTAHSAAFKKSKHETTILQSSLWNLIKLEKGVLYVTKLELTKMGKRAIYWRQQMVQKNSFYQSAKT